MRPPIISGGFVDSEKGRNINIDTQVKKKEKKN